MPNKSLLNITEQATAQVHELTEEMDFLSHYKNHNITTKMHEDHLMQLQRIYQCLEEHPLMEANPIAQLLHCAKISSRYSQIRKDLSDTKTSPLLPSTLKYCNYIQSIDQWPIFLAHLLVRYYGDLFGGQKLKQHLFDSNPLISTYLYEFSNKSKSLRVLSNSAQARDITCRFQEINESCGALLRATPRAIALSCSSKLCVALVLTITFAYCSPLLAILPTIYTIFRLSANLFNTRETWEKTYEQECQRAFKYQQPIFKDLAKKHGLPVEPKALQAKINAGQCPLGFSV